MYLHCELLFFYVFTDAVQVLMASANATKIYSRKIATTTLGRSAKWSVILWLVQFDLQFNERKSTRKQTTIAQLQLGAKRSISCLNKCTSKGNAETTRLLIQTWFGTFSVTPPSTIFSITVLSFQYHWHPLLYVTVQQTRLSFKELADTSYHDSQAWLTSSSPGVYPGQGF